MLDETGIRVMRLRGQGWCCAQIVILLLLEDMGRQGPDLAQAARGLCFGLGDLAGPCGALTGGCLALGLTAGGDPGDPGAQSAADERLRPMLGELSAWFREEMGARHHGITCQDIIGPGATGPDPARCGPAIVETYDKIMEILARRDIDPTAHAS